MALEKRPVIVYWGPNRTIIYNEAHVPLVGTRHPEMLGRNAADEFPVFWHYFDSILNEQARTGQEVSAEASQLLMVRHGFLEETYFDWKLVPIIGEDGTMLGGYGTPTDRTKEIIANRRNLCVQSLSKRVANVSSFDDLWKPAMLGLAENEKDIPFALLYANDGLSKFLPRTSNFKLVGTLGVPDNHKLRTLTVDIEDIEDGFASAIAQAVKTTQTITISADDPSIHDYLDSLEWRGSNTPCSEFAVVPIVAGTDAAMVLVMGINPYRTFNNLYEDFVGMLVDILASHVSKLQLSEEIRHSTEIASKATRDFERSEMRFSRFASRSIIGLVVADVTGQVSQVRPLYSELRSL